jgi:hypothetical protein
MTPTERVLLERAIKHYGEGNQILKALEEMTELSHELWIVYNGEQIRTQCVLEEMADVRIMLDQLELIFDDSSEYRKCKLERLAKRIGE